MIENFKEIIRAAFVIARRDFTAIIFSKSFFFLLIGAALSPDNRLGCWWTWQTGQSGY